MSSRAERNLVFLVFALFPFMAGADDVAPQISRPPNIVFVAIDTLRNDHLGCYGYHRRVSPNIDALASQGVLFEQCYSVASWTLPSFMSMFTGLMPVVHGCTSQDCQALSRAIPTLPEQFKQRGYFCAAVVSNPYVNGKYGFKRGFDEYDDYSVFLEAELALFSVDVHQDRGSVQDVVTGDIVTQQAKLLMDRAKASGKPFFLFILYFDPHESYIPPPPYNKMFDPDYQGKIDGRGVSSMRYSPPTGRDLQHLTAQYDGEIAYTDAKVGELLKKLDSISEPTNTITILVSDHGEAFGEHGMLLHGNNAYREEICIPMIWRWPGVLPRGHRVRAPVSNIDIATTLKELMHFEKLKPIQGESLWPGLLGGQLPGDRPIFSQKAFGSSFTHLALTLGNLRCHARFEDKLDEKTGFALYDLSQDPWEQNNVIGTRRLQIPGMKSSIARSSTRWNPAFYQFYRG